MSVTTQTTYLAQLVAQAKTRATERKFTQSVELAINLKDIDMKKQESILNETIFLPNTFSSKQKICLFASGDVAVRAKETEIDKIIGPEELNTLSETKREARKIAKLYNVFLAETTLMPQIGKVLGQFLGPSGKMPTPVPPNAPLDGFVKRFSSIARVRTKGQLTTACKVGDEKMSDEQIAQNAEAVLSAVEKKLPSGKGNIKNIVFKLSMSPSQKSKVQ